MNPHQALIAHSAALPFPRESIGGRPGVCQGDSPDTPPNFALVPALFPQFLCNSGKKKNNNKQFSAPSVLGPVPPCGLARKTSGQSWEDYRACSAVAGQGLQRQERLSPKLGRPRAQGVAEGLGSVPGSGRGGPETPPTTCRWAGLACPGTKGPTLPCLSFFMNKRWLIDSTLLTTWVSVTNAAITIFNIR